MDLLSETLLSLKIKNMLIATIHLSQPWGFTSKGYRQGMSFNILENRCWLRPEGLDAIELYAGDSLIFPRGGLMNLSSDLDSEIVPLHHITNEPKKDFEGFDSYLPGDYKKVSCGSGKNVTGMLGVFFEIEQQSHSALFDALPALIILRKDECPDSKVIKDALCSIVSEEKNELPGEYAIKNNLSEALLRSQLRAHVIQTDYSSGIIAAIKDPFLHRALVALHANPERKWTVASLANQARLSRTGFALRFSQTLNDSPMNYLRKQRMQLAVSMLKNTELNIEKIAHSLGYMSVKVFRKHFIKQYELAPSKFRKQFS